MIVVFGVVTLVRKRRNIAVKRKNNICLVIIRFNSGNYRSALFFKRLWSIDYQLVTDTVRDKALMVRGSSLDEKLVRGENLFNSKIVAVDIQSIVKRVRDIAVSDNHLAVALD